jgi:hypothetical protein
LGLPLALVQNFTTSTEFLQWQDYLEEEVNDFHREDYFLAAIALEVRRSYVKDPTKYKIEDFLHTFKKKQAPEPAKEEERRDLTTEDIKRIKAENSAKSHAFWFALTGVKKPSKN